MNIHTEIKYLDLQLSYLREAIQALSPEQVGFKEITSVIGPLLTLTHETGRSTLLLAQNNNLRDLIILSRPFFEGIINIGFICAKGDEGVVQAQKHAYQKGYRDLFRDLEVHEFKIANPLVDHKDIIDGHRPAAMIEALNEYTTKKGSEIASWTTETSKEKLEIIAKKYGVYVNGLLGFAFFVIYRDVSEVIHGSYYGARIFLGMQQRDITAFRSSEEAASYFTDHQFKLAALVLQQVTTSTHAIIDILRQTFLDVAALEEIRVSSNAALLKYTEELQALQKSNSAS